MMERTQRLFVVVFDIDVVCCYRVNLQTRLRARGKLFELSQPKIQCQYLFRIVDNTVMEGESERGRHIVV